MTLVQERPAAEESLAADGTDPRRTLRRWLYLAGLVPLVVGLALGLKVGVMLHHDHAGQRAWDDDNPARAMEQYSANRSLNLLQPWIALFDSGDASFRMHDYPHAVRWFEQALDHAPKRQECTVRINLSLTQEAIGDEAEKAGNHARAKAAWTDALATLKEGHCPTKASDRLQQKLQEKQPPKNQQKPQQQKKTPDQGDQQQQNLDKRNGQGQKYKSQYQDLEDYGGFSDEPQW